MLEQGKGGVQRPDDSHDEPGEQHGQRVHAPHSVRAELPAPGPQERARLWRTAFPPTLDCTRVDFAVLARADIAGGTIRSVAMNAVFMAVSRGEVLSDAIVHEALRLEYRKLGRLVLDEGSLWDR